MKCVSCDNDSKTVPGISWASIEKGFYYICFECDSESFEKHPRCRTTQHITGNGWIYNAMIDGKNNEMHGM